MFLKRTLSALLAGLITGLGALLAVAMQMPAGSEIGDISSITWLVIGVTTLLTSAKDLQLYLRSSKA